MSNYKDFITKDIMPLGALVTLADPPTDGTYIPSGSYVTRTAYPELSYAFNYPKFDSNPVVNPTNKNVSYSGYTLLAYSGSMYVALHKTNNTNLYLTSPDGTTWTQRAFSYSYGWKTIIWTGGLFFALPSALFLVPATFLTSPDGITWTQQTLPTQTGLASVVWNGSFFCGVCSGVRAYTSPDAVTWTTQTTPNYAWVDVAWNGSVFCAVANNSTYSMSSPDGVSWSTTNIYWIAPWIKIIAVGSVFYAFDTSYSPLMYYSTNNGASWNYIYYTGITNTAGTWIDFTYGGGLFCTVSTDGQIAVSADAVTWKTIVTGATVAFDNVIYNGSGFYMSNTSAVWGIQYSLVTYDSFANIMNLGTAIPNEYIRVK